MKKVLIFIVLAVLFFSSCNINNVKTEDSSSLSTPNVVSITPSPQSLPLEEDVALASNNNSLPTNSDPSIVFTPENATANGYYKLEGYSRVEYPSDDLVLACDNVSGLFGFLSATNLYITVIPFEYEDAFSYSEGFSAVKKNGKWGYIDTSHNVILDFAFDYALPAENGVAFVFPVYKPAWQENYSIEPDITIYKYALYEISGKLIYECPYTIKSSKDNTFYPYAYLNNREYPEIVSNDSALVDFDINGLIRGTQSTDPNSTLEHYKNEPVYTVLEWNDNIEYSLEQIK